jgi:regulator of protease activity HflC (stomatin/prohibitin superfamily)
MNKETTMHNTIIGKILGGIIGIFAIITLFCSFYTIDSGERGIVLTWGKATSVSNDGIHLKIPFAQSITKVDIRTMKTKNNADAGTMDMQTASTEVTVNYHLDQTKLIKIYSNYGLDIEDKIIMPRIQETVKAVVANYSAENLLKKREYVKSDIETNLKNALAQYDIILEGVAITNFAFSEAFDDAIEAKQIAEQNALKSHNDLDRIKIEAEQKVTIAKAEAEAIKIQTEAIQANGGESYVRLKAIDKWNGVLPTYTGTSMPFIKVQ